MRTSGTPVGWRAKAAALLVAVLILAGSGAGALTGLAATAPAPAAAAPMLDGGHAPASGPLVQPPAPRSFAPQPMYLSNGAAQNFSPFAPSPFTYAGLSIGPNVDGFNIASLPSITVNQSGNLTVGYNGTWNPAPSFAPDRDWVLAIVVRNGSPQAFVLEANTTVRIAVNNSSLPATAYFGLPSTTADTGQVSSARVFALPPGGNLTVLNLTSANAGISLTGNTALPPMFTDSVWFNASGSYPGSGVLVGSQTMVVFVPSDGGVPIEVRAGRVTQWTNASHFPGGRFLSLKGGTVAIIGGNFRVTVWNRGSPESSLYLNATVNPSAAVRPDTLNTTGLVGNKSMELTTSWNMSTNSVLPFLNYNSVICNQVIRLNNGTYRMFCSWQDNSGGGSSGVDSAWSPDGRIWGREPGTRYSLCGAKYQINQISIVKTLDGTLRMYYGGSDPLLGCTVFGSGIHTSSATSTNEGVTWALEVETLGTFTVGAPDAMAVAPTTDGRLRMYLDSNSGLSTALSDDGLNWAFEATIGGSLPRVVYALTSGAYKMYYGTSTVLSRLSANGLAWSSATTEVPQWGAGNIEAGMVLDRGDGVPLILVYSQSNGLFVGSANQTIVPAARVDLVGRLSDGTPFGNNSTAAGARGSFQLNSTVPAPAPLGRYQLTASAGFGENRFKGLVLNRMPLWTGPTAVNATEDIPLVLDLATFVTESDPADNLAFFANSPYLVNMSGANATLLYPNGVLTNTIVGTVNDGHDNVPFALFVNVTPVNDPPVLNLSVSYTIMEDNLSLIDLASEASDEETADSALVLGTNISGATVIGLIIALNITDPGSYDATVTLSDGTTTVNATTVIIVIPHNDAPTLNLNPQYHRLEGVVVSINLTSAINDPDSPDANLTVTTNLTNVTITGLVISLQRDSPMNISFSVTVMDEFSSVTDTSVLFIDPTNDAPQWIGSPDLTGLTEDVTMDIDLAPFASDEETASQSLTFASSSLFATVSGTHLILLYPNNQLTDGIDLTVSDGLLSAQIHVDAVIAPVNDPPVLSNAPPSNYTAGGVLQFQFNVTDPDDSTGFAFDLQTNQSWITLSPTGLLTVNTTGQHGHFAYSVRVRDASGADAGFVNFTFDPPLNGLPTMAPSFAQLRSDAVLDIAFSVSFNVSDPDNDAIAASIEGYDSSQTPTLAPLGGNRWLLAWTPTYPGHAPPFERWLNGTLVLNDSFGAARFAFAIRAVDPASTDPFIDPEIPAILGNASQEITIDLDGFMHDADANDQGRLFWTVDLLGQTANVVLVEYDRPNQNITVHFITNGTGLIRFTLFDPGMRSDSQLVTVGPWVAPPPPPPPAGGGTEPFPWWLLLLIAGGAAAAGAAVVYRRRAAAAALEEVPARAPPSEPIPPPRQVVVPKAPPVVATQGARRKFLVEDIFLLYRDGRTIFSRTGLGADAVDDPESVGAMLIAVQDFVKDSFRKESPVDRMGYGDNVILLEQGDHEMLAVTVFGEPDREFRELMGETIQNVEGTYAGVIESWSGNKADFRGVESLLAPLWQLTAHLTRGDVLLATTAREVQVLSGIEFFQGFVRLKLGVVNNTPTVITNVTVDLDFNADVLRLHKIEPSGYKSAAAKVNLGVLHSGEKATLAYYFDPQICTMSMIDGTARYKDAEGTQHVVQMKSRKAEVVCPLFFTKENANTALLRRLVETELNQFDVRVYGFRAGAKKEQLSALYEAMKGAVMAHDVQLVRAFEAHNPYAGEAWFYGKTQVKGYQMVIRAIVDAEKGRAEFFVASTVMRAVTGLLAELNHTFQESAGKRFGELGVESLFDEEVRAEYADPKAVSKMIEGEAAAGDNEAP